MTLKITADNIDLNTLTSVSGPKITLIDYPGDDLATPPAGGATVAIAGTGFVNGCQVLINTTYANTVTFVSSSSITFTTPALTAGTYPIYVINPDGGTAIGIPGISYSGVPAFATTSGSLGTVYEGAAFNSTIAATSDSAVTYTIDSGALPAGFSLNANTGAIAGNVGTISNSTTYNFTVKATDTELQDTTRNFSITTSPDVVTFNTPAGNQTYSNSTSDAFSLTLNASSVLGTTISYTANALPSGLTLSGNVISGTFSSASSVASLITATAATSLKTATRLLNWVITSPPTSSVEYLVVAGGGGGGTAYSGIGGEGGGGGAGGALTGTVLITPQTYVITVGAGGASGDGGTSQNQRGNPGTSSSGFGILTYPGGGGGSSGSTGGQTAPSGTWGSGGGGGGGGQGNGSGAAGTAGQGYAGGGGNQYNTGGGGGAGGTATDWTPAGAPLLDGGIGITSTISGSLVNYAGGGGGAGANASGVPGGNAYPGTPVTRRAGGLYGGGIGWNNASPYGDGANRPGLVNTGGGGGGGKNDSGGSGGSGIVIIRYSDAYAAATSTTGSPTVTVSGGYRVYQFTSSGSITF